MSSTSKSSQNTANSGRNVCDYFVCVGLPTGQGASSPVRLENPSNPVEKEDALKDPITDITIINVHEGPTLQFSLLVRNCIKFVFNVNF